MIRPSGHTKGTSSRIAHCQSITPVPLQLRSRSWQRSPSRSPSRPATAPRPAHSNTRRPAGPATTRSTAVSTPMAATWSAHHRSDLRASHRTSTVVAASASSCRGATTVLSRKRPLPGGRIQVWTLDCFIFWHSQNPRPYEPVSARYHHNGLSLINILFYCLFCVIIYKFRVNIRTI